MSGDGLTTRRENERTVRTEAFKVARNETERWEGTGGKQLSNERGAREVLC